MTRPATVARTVLAPALLAMLLVSSTPQSSEAEIYELRTYVTNEGKLDDLNARFRDHTVRLFAKHGMESVGYWVPTDEPSSQNTLIYILKHDSREAARESWEGFLADPEWREAARASEADGRILAASPESVFMETTDYSPDWSSDREADDAGVFELRIYRTNEGKLDNLDARFRNHTVRLFDRHGMQSVGYWHPVDGSDSTDTLIYILKHESREAARASWSAFGSDPEWQRVARESQVNGRFLRERPESIYMRATDYSAIR